MTRLEDKESTVFMDPLFAARHELSVMEDVKTMGPARPCATVQMTETLAGFLRSLLPEDGLRGQSPNADSSPGLSNEGRATCTWPEGGHSKCLL